MTTNSTPGTRRGRGFFTRNAIVFVMLGLAVVVSLIEPRFLNPQNLLNVGMQISINGVLAVGMTWVILTGGIDLSIGSTVAISGLLASMFVVKYPMTSPVAATLASLGIALAVGLACGLFNGIVVTKFRVTPFITTLANLSIIRGVCFLLTDSRPIFGISDNVTWIGQGHIGPVPVAVVILLIAVALAALVLGKTPFGRYVYAVGGNDEVARLSGISTTRIKICVYVISGVLASLGGYIYMSRLQSGQPNAGVGYELQAIAATVVGGTSLSGGVGTVWGTFFGALIIGILNNGMSLMQVSSYWQNVFTGVVILAAVAFNEYLTARSERS